MDTEGYDQKIQNYYALSNLVESEQNNDHHRCNGQKPRHWQGQQNALAHL